MKNNGSNLVKEMFNRTLTIQIVSAVIGVLGVVVDSVVIGMFLAPECMSAYGLSSPLTVGFAAIAGLIGLGITTLTGQLLGKGQMKDTSDAISVVLVFSVVISLLISTLVCLLANPLAYLLGADELLLADTADYIKGLAFSLPFIILVNVLMPVMQFDNDGKRVFVAIFFMTSTNILLDFANALIFQQGMLGMALATTLSYVVAFLVMLLHFFGKKKVIHLSVRSLQWKFIPTVLQMGIPRFVSLMCNSLAGICINKIFMFYGYTSAVAVLAMITSGGQLCMVAVQGIGSTVQMLASVFAGEEDVESLKDLVNYGFKKVLYINAVIILLVIVFAKQFTSCFFSGQADTLQTAIHAIRLYIPMLIPVGLTQVVLGYMQGMKKYRMSLLLSVLGTFVLEVVCIFVLLITAGVSFVWLGYTIAFVLLLLIYGGIAACKKKTLKLSTEDLLLLDDDFGVRAENRMDCSVQSMEAVMEASEAGRQFCLSHNAGARTAYLIGLTIEEMAGNVVQHGFQEGKNNSIDIRVGYKNEDWFLRIKDNCLEYDPTKYYKLFDVMPPESHVGVRMVAKTAKSMRYVYALSVNTLTVRI